jgi:hypothetical protein
MARMILTVGLAVLLAACGGDRLAKPNCTGKLRPVNASLSAAGGAPAERPVGAQR